MPRSGCSVLHVVNPTYKKKKKIHPPIKGLLLPIGIETTTFQNSVSKVSGYQMHTIDTLQYLHTIF